MVTNQSPAPFESDKLCTLKSYRSKCKCGKLCSQEPLEKKKTSKKEIESPKDSRGRPPRYHCWKCVISVRQETIMESAVVTRRLIDWECL